MGISPKERPIKKDSATILLFIYKTFTIRMLIISRNVW
jgi:hypothetical protein